MTIHSFSDPFKEHCEYRIRGLDVEVTSQAFKICAQATSALVPLGPGEEGSQEEHVHCCEQRVWLVPIRNVENQVLPDRNYC